MHLNGHEIALWSGVAAYFSSLIAIGIFNFLNPDQIYDFFAALIVAFITAGAVYARQRMDEAKEKKQKDYKGES